MKACEQSTDFISPLWEWVSCGKIIERHQRMSLPAYFIKLRFKKALG